MVSKARFDDSGDTQELQALFDSIAAQPQRPRLEVVNEPNPSGDNDDLQALFDTLQSDYCATHEVAPAASAPAQASAPAAACPVVPERRGDDPPGSGEVFNRIGAMARRLHDVLRELGLDKKLEKTAQAIPDARQRLNYIAQMTEQAASRVLNATDLALPVQDRLQGDAETLAARWDEAYQNRLDTAQFKALAGQTREFLRAVPAQTQATRAQLMEIMMAQDFQDLTGQVIKKVLTLAHGLESDLVGLLVDVMPSERRASAPEGLLNGPVVDTGGRADVVTSQTQVDDLLDSLGF